MTIFPTKVLVASDGSEEASLAATTAADIAEKTGSELHLVHVRSIPRYIDPSIERDRYFADVEEAVRKEFLDEQVEQIQDAGGTVVEAHVRLGPPVEEIAGLADEIGAGLVVMGSRGRGGLRRRLLGSISEGVARHAHCTVVIVRK